jgi:hypothetical protein
MDSMTKSPGSGTFPDQKKLYGSGNASALIVEKLLETKSPNH